MFAFSQTGTVSGTILDKEYNDEPLPFANISIKGTSKGSSTDDNGKYSIANIEPGSYTLIIAYVGYETKEIPFTLKAGETKVINETLAASGVQLKDIVVQTTVSKEKETTLLLEQQKSVEIKQSIGSQELSRKGISDVATAVAKTTGISKQEGSNNIYVRGLGDRYNSTSMNGLPVASNDPEKKNISLDLFSTDIVEYIGIDKVYSSRMWGDFAGGNVDISSKNYKGNGLFEISIGANANSNALSKNGSFYLQDGPSNWGYSNYGLPSDPLNSYNYKNSLNPIRETPWGSDIGLKAGKSFNIGNQGRLNLFATANFNNGFTYREGINQTIDAQSQWLKSLYQKQYAYNTNTTGMFNANYVINNNHKIGYNFLFVNSSNQKLDTYTGYSRDYGEDNDILIQRGTYTQNTLQIHQLLGNHKLTDRTNLDWGASYNTIESDMPDRIQNTFKLDEDSNSYVFGQNAVSDNHRYFQNLVEDEIAGRLAISYKLGINEEGYSKGKITIGYNGRSKNRDFWAFQANHRINATQLNTIVDPNNLDSFFNQQNFGNGLFTLQAFAGEKPQTYTGEQNIHAGFATFEYQLTDKLSTIVSLRGEKIEQIVSWHTQLDFTGDSNTINRNEILPSLILKYELNEKQNLRFGASKTYTLPQFKERAYFIYEDVTEIKIGNPDLYPSQNYNADLKWEYFPKTNELISLTAFGKYIIDPMNETNLASSTNDISFINTGDYGYVYGIEAEIRKNIFELDELKNNRLSFGLNISLMQTEQELNSKKVQEETIYNVNLTDSKADFTGASNLLLNTDLTYNRDLKGEGNLMATLTYSYYSDRLYALGIEEKGNLVDKGMGALDFILKTKLTKNIGLNFNAKNILNPRFNRVQENNGGDITVLSYKKGTNFSLGINYNF